MPHRLALTRLFLLLVTPLLLLAACTLSPPASPPADATHTTSTAIPAVSPTSMPVATVTQVAQAAAITASSKATTGCPPTMEAEIDPAASLVMGPGPGIPASTSAGEKLVIVGTVYAEDCTPLAGAVLNFHQADASGEYGPGHGTDDMRCCYLMGSLRTDSNGRYQLITVKPAHYKGEQLPPPAHIHVEVLHPQAGVPGTEIVFAGDPYLPESLDGYTLVNLETVPALEGAAAHLRGVADIILDQR
jgi:protocatechuate 3,4-dioxygenase beta subunit